jgi:hypothetical protein
MLAQHACNVAGTKLGSFGKFLLYTVIARNSYIATDLMSFFWVPHFCQEIMDVKGIAGDMGRSVEETCTT